MRFLLPKCCMVMKAEMRFGFELKKRKENVSTILKAVVLTVDNPRRILNSILFDSYIFFFNSQLFSIDLINTLAL